MELVKVSGTEEEKNMNDFFNPYNINKVLSSLSSLSVTKNINRTFESSRENNGSGISYYNVKLNFFGRTFRSSSSSDYYSTCTSFSKKTYLTSQDDFNGQTPSGKWCVSDSSSYLFGQKSNDFNYLYDGNLFIYIPYTHYISSSKTYNYGYLKYKVHFSDDNYIGEYNSYEQYGMNTAISSGMDSDMDPVLLGGYGLNWNGCEAIALHNLNISLNEDYSSNKYPDRVNNIVDYFNKDNKFAWNILTNTATAIAAGSVLFPVNAALTAEAISAAAFLKSVNKGNFGVRSGAISDYLKQGDYDYYAINKDFARNYLFDYENGKDEFLEKVKTDTDYSRYILSYKNIAGELSSAIHTIFVEKVNLNRQEKYLVYNAGNGNKKVFFNSFDEILSGRSFVSGWGIKSNGKIKNYVSINDTSGKITSGTGYYKPGEKATLTSSGKVVASNKTEFDGTATFTVGNERIIVAPDNSGSVVFTKFTYVYLTSKTKYTFNPSDHYNLNNEHGKYGRHYLKMHFSFHIEFPKNDTVKVTVKQGDNVKLITYASLGNDCDKYLTVELTGQDITFELTTTSDSMIWVENFTMSYYTDWTRF